VIFVEMEFYDPARNFSAFIETFEDFLSTE
jgi:hypothetical protein